MMEAAPTPPLKVVEAQFLLELLVVPFDPPAHLGGADQVNQGGRRRQGRQPILARLLLSFRPLDQQPFLGVRLSTPVVAVRRPHPHGSKAPLQLAASAFPPAHRLPSARRQSQGEILGGDRLVLGIPAPQLGWPSRTGPWLGWWGCVGVSAAVYAKQPMKPGTLPA